MSRLRGGSVSLTAFEAAWLRMVVDMADAEAIDALPHVGKPPRRIANDPHEAWDRIVQKISNIAPVMEDHPHV